MLEPFTSVSQDIKWPFGSNLQIGQMFTMQNMKLKKIHLGDFRSTGLKVSVPKKTLLPLLKIKRYPYMKAGQRDIFYLSAPSRQLAESSPYYENLRKNNVEVIFCYESYDELVLMQLQEFNNLKLTSVEKEMRQDKDEAIDTEGSLPVREQSELSDWIKVRFFFLSVFCICL